MESLNDFLFPTILNQSKINALNTFRRTITEESDLSVDNIYNGLKVSELQRILSQSKDEEDDSEDTQYELMKPGFKHRILQAKVNNVLYSQGDTVLLSSGLKYPYIAIIIRFRNDRGNASVQHLWFSTWPEIRDENRLKDMEKNEIFISSMVDNSPIESILGHAQVLSYKEYTKLSVQERKRQNLFFCRRGVELRKMRYTPILDWDEVYKEVQNKDHAMDMIVRKIQNLKSEDADFISPKESSRSKQRVIKEVPDEESISRTPKRQKNITPKSSKPTISDAYDAAYKSLVTTEECKPLLCREEEYNEILARIERAIMDVSGTTIYVAGTPGTGKTATIRRVIATLHDKVRRRALDDFVYSEINGMKLPHPKQAYSILYKAIYQKGCSAKFAHQYLNQMFSKPSPSRTPIVVFMDELDQLISKNQSVIYNFFNWPTIPGSQLIVIGCANTMDLPERMLFNKISSRMGLTRVSFEPYSYAQLKEIIQNLLKTSSGGFTLMEESAIEFIARKVAAVTGDARRAIDITRRSIGLAKRECNDSEDTESNAKSITIGTVRRALSEMISSPTQAHIQSLPFMCRLYLMALLNSNRRKGTADESTCKDCFEEALRIVSTNGDQFEIQKVSYVINCKQNWLYVLQVLQDSRILSLENTRRSWSYRRCKLQIPDNDLSIALEDEKQLFMKQ